MVPTPRSEHQSPKGEGVTDPLWDTLNQTFTI